MAGDSLNVKQLPHVYSDQDFFQNLWDAQRSVRSGCHDVVMATPVRWMVEIKAGFGWCCQGKKG